MTEKEAARLGAFIADRRAELGLSAREVGRRAVVDAATVSRLEQGLIPNPRGDNLAAIGAALEIPAADLFAMIDWLPAGQLPELVPYLRAKYDDMPSADVRELERFFDRLRRKHGSRGPAKGEDEH